MDLRQMNYFVSIVDHHSVSAAAAKLGIAQPSLSDVLGKLERELDVQLLVRTPRGTRMTEAGAALARHSRDILARVDAATQDIRRLGGNGGGPVSIGLPPSMALLLSVPLAETIRNDFPGIRLRIVEGMSGYVLDWLDSGHIDLACLYEAPDSASFTSQPILNEDLFLVTAPDHWPDVPVVNGVAAEGIDFAEAAKLPLVLPSRPHGLREIVERHARTAGLTTNVVMEVDSLLHILKLVDRASAYTILSHAACLELVNDGRLILVPIGKPALQRTAYLARKNSTLATTPSLQVEGVVRTIIEETIRRYRLKATLPSPR
jgi:LysR family nitrogen assimilation transcriptional regulator